MAHAQDNISVTGPDENLEVEVSVNEGKVLYNVSYKGKTFVENSPLGLKTNAGDFTSGLSFAESSRGEVEKEYTQDKIKRSELSYKANTLKYTLKNKAYK